MKRHNTARKVQFEQLENRVVFSASPNDWMLSSILSQYSVNGSGNNVSNPSWGSAGSDLLRIATAAYGDGISTPAGSTRPSARVVSNTVADQGGQDIINDRLMSAMVYVWGQFIDHDIGLTPSGSETFNVAVPSGDPSFDPNSTGTKSIPLNRSIYDALTGTTNARQQLNVITAWIDGSMIYGSDAATAAALRTFSGGKLKSSAGNLLPLNDSTTLPSGTLSMANDSHLVPNDQLFAAGDVRANENIELTALQTLFMREHNYWASKIKAANGSSTDEQIYQRARAIVIGEIQSITYNSWLPAVLGRGALDRYAGYDPTVNPELANEFSTAAFRFGHSMLGDDVEFLDNQGLPVANEVSLSGAFFNPPLVQANGIEPLLKYMASDPASEIDTKVVDSIRNFLFGPPGSGGLDLASLNIQRGRDHGLADYNTVRAAYGLPKVNSFSQITSDVELQGKLQQLYGSVDNIDLWVGALAENHVQGASVGPTLRAIISDQFERLRDGDRFWYQKAFSGKLLNEIESTSLTDIIKRNTTLTNLQDDAFFFRAAISGSLYIDADRSGRPSRGDQPLAGREVKLLDSESGEVIAITMTNDRGEYRFDVADGIRTGKYVVQVTPVAADGPNANLSGRVSITRGDQMMEPVDFALPPKPMLPPPPQGGPGPMPPPKNGPQNPPPQLPGRNLVNQPVASPTVDPRAKPALNSDPRGLPAAAVDRLMDDPFVLNTKVRL
jgi:peroxidase